MTSPTPSPAPAPRPPTTSQTRRALTAMRALEGNALQSALARTVAAMLCDDPTSALDRFATTGALDAEAVLDELDQVQVPFEEEAWIDALARFVLFTTGGQR